MRCLGKCRRTSLVLGIRTIGIYANAIEAASGQFRFGRPYARTAKYISCFINPSKAADSALE